MAGRPSLLTPAIQERICHAISAGAGNTTAAHYAGIAVSTLQDWLKRGEEGKEGDELYVSFSEAIKKARAEREVLWLLEVSEGRRGWQSKCWLLERTNPEEFGWAKRPEYQAAEKIEIIFHRPAEDPNARSDSIDAPSDQGEPK